MSTIPPCMWGSRLAVPLGGVEGGISSIDDVRSLVVAVHTQLEVEYPRDDYFLNLLGTGRLTGRLPMGLAHLKGVVVVILGAYKIRQPHVDALEVVRRSGGGVLSTLAAATREIGSLRVRDCVDVLVSEVRGGPWCWTTDGSTCLNEEELDQEHRAWVHLGAAPRDVRLEHMLKMLEHMLKRIVDIEEKHGGADPAKWRWGTGTPCVDVFAADDAKRAYEDLKAKYEYIKTKAGSCHSAVASDDPPPRGASRDRSRSAGR